MRQLRSYQFLTINAYWLGLGIMGGTITPLILPWIADRFSPVELGGFISLEKNSALGFLRAAGLAVAILIQPIAGTLSDRSTLRWGRRRPFILTGTALDLVFLALIAAATNFWMALLALMLLQFSSNIAHGALQGLIPDIVPEDQRGRVSGVKSFLEVLAIVLVSVIGVGTLIDRGEVGSAVLILMVGLVATMLVTLTVSERQGQEPTEPLGPRVSRIVWLTLIFGAAFIVALSLVGVVGSLLSGAGMAQLVGVGLAGLAAMAGAIVIGVSFSARVGIGEGIREHPAFVWWVTNRLLFFAGVGSIQGFALFFLDDVVGVANPAQATATLMAVLGVFTLVAAVGSGFLGDRYGRKPLLMLSGLVAGGGTFVLLMASSLGMVYAVGILLGLATGTFIVTNWAMGTELVPADEAGRYLGVSNLAGGGAGLVGVGIGGPLADFFNGFSPGSGYLVVFAIYAVLFLLSSVVLLKVPETLKRRTGEAAPA
ncbi:MAG: MFS transporter [Anaerolineae bacterium]